MSWPLPQDFNEAVQTPGLAFRDPDLKAGQPVVGASGLPLPRSGNFADVYQVRTPKGDFAVKCFTRPVTGLDHRYDEVGKALARANLPFAVAFTYLAEGIRVRGEWRPAVKMDWVNGLQLNQFVRENAGSPAALGALFQVWVRLCRRLREGGIAHADLQHGNVLLVPGSRAGAVGVKLIDYDGMYVPALANQPSGEAGHPCYQHPDRAAKHVYSPDLDRFPHLVIATAIRGLIARGAALWDRHDTGDNLLFTEADFRNPSGSALLRELWEAGDPKLRALVGHLAVACRKPIPRTPWLDQVAPDGEPVPLTPAAEREAADALGLAPPVAVAEAVPAATEWENITDEAKPVPASERRPAAKKRAAKPPAAARGGAGLLLIAGAVVLAIGAAVGGAILLGGKKKPDETAQAPDTEHKEPPPAVAPSEKPKPPPKAQTPAAKVNGGSGPAVPPAGTQEDPPQPITDPTPMVTPAVTVAPAGSFEPTGAPALTARWQRNLGSAAFGLRVTPDGRTLVASTGGPPRILTAENGAVTGTFAGSGPPPVAVAPFGNDQAIGLVPGAARFWNLRTGARSTRRQEIAPDVITASTAHALLELSPDRRYAVVARVLSPLGQGEPGLLKVRDLQTNTDIITLEVRQPKCAFLADGRLLIVDGVQFRWYHLPSGRQDRARSFSPAPLPYVSACAADGSRLLLTSDGRRLGLFNGLTAEREVNLPDRFGPVHQPAAFSHDGKLLAISSTDPDTRRSHLEVIDAAARQVLGRYLLSEQGVLDVTAVAFTPDAKSVVVGRSSGAVELIDVAPANAVAAAPKVNVPPAKAANPPTTVAAKADPNALRAGWTRPVEAGIRPNAVQLTADSRVVLLGSTTEGSVAGFALGDGAPYPGVRTISLGGPVRSLTPLAGGLFATYVFGDPVVLLWNIQTGKSAGKITVPEVPADEALKGRLVVPSPSAAYIAVGRYGDAAGQLRVFEANSTPEKVLLSTDWKGGEAFFTADSSRLLLAESSGRFRWFKLPSGQPDGGWEFPRGPGRNHHALALSPDGKTLLYGGAADKGAERPYLLDARTGQVVREFPAGSFLTHIGSMSDDARVVALLRGDRDDMVIDVFDDGKPAGSVRVRLGPDRMVPLFAVSPDGKRLIVYRNGRLSAHPLGAEAVALAAANPPDPPDPPADPTPGPAPKPADPPPNPAVAAADAAELREKWSAGTEPKTGLVRFDRAGRFVVYSHRGELAAEPFDARTGTAGPKWAGGATGSWLPLPMDGSKFAFVPNDAGPVRVWDAAANKVTTIDVPPPPPAAASSGMVVRVSPDGRFVAASRRSPGIDPGPGGGAKPEPVALRVTDVQTGQPVVSLDWVSGSVHFTADSARVLVVDAAAKFRWFKLPSGEPDGEWTYDKEPSSFNSDVQAVSGRGEFVLYHGAPTGRPESYYLLDGRTGRVKKSFQPKAYHPGSAAISEDGGVVALVRNDGFGAGHTVEVFHAPGRLVGKVKLDAGPQGHQGATVALSPDGRLLAVHNRSTHKVSVYDVPAIGAVAAAPAPPGPAPKPADPPPAGAPAALKSRWSATAESAFGSWHVTFDSDGRVVYFASRSSGGTRAFQARTGAPHTVAGAEAKTLELGFIPLPKGRVGAYSFQDGGVLLWDSAGKPVGRVGFPPGVPGGSVSGSVITLSPNGRYLVVGRPESARVDRDTKQVVRTPGALRVYDTLNASRQVVGFDWSGGSVLFTANSTRVLVAERSGRYRWFKLPTGQPDGEWDFGGGTEKNPGFGRHNVEGLSDDGRTLLYRGPGRDRADGLYLIDANTGQVVRPLGKGLAFSASMSTDGRVVACTRPAGGTFQLEVYDGPSGTLTAQAAIGPVGGQPPTVTVSPDGVSVAVYDPGATKLTVYDGPGGAVAVRPAAADPSATAVPANRLPVPAGDALTKAEANVRGVLKDEYARRQPAEKKALAQKLLTLAGETADDAAARYVMLRDARDLAAEVGDLPLAAQAIDALARGYEVDPAAAKVALLEKVVAGTTISATLKTANELAAAGADAAFDADDYADAVKLAQLAATAARKGNLGASVVDDAEFRLASLKKVRDAFEAVKPALEKLKAAPGDPEANLAAGRFRCLVQGRWADGLQLLTKGNNPTLKQAAELELAAPRTGPADVRIADAWWEFAQSAPEAEKRAAEGRARYWYARAVPGLSGLPKVRAESRLGFTLGGVEYKPGLVAEFSARAASVLKGKRSRVDQTIDFSAGEFADAAKQTDVTVKWTGVILAPRPGRYRLVAGTTDSVRVRVDNKTVIDTMTNKGGRREAAVALSDRPAAIVVEFTAPNTERHRIKLSWVAPGGTEEEAVPAEALFHDRRSEPPGGK